jgi:F-box protein 18 (helicase)
LVSNLGTSLSFLSLSLTYSRHFISLLSCISLGYLKLYQLSPTDFAVEEGWNVLLIDEAQDLTPAIIDLVTQTSCAKIFVGDPHQQIYSFRGATNAMPLVRADHTYYLTRVSRDMLISSNYKH